MKKLLLVILILVLPLFVGCHESEKKENKNITLSFGVQDNPGNPIYTAYEAFADHISEISGGTMMVQIYPSSQLGTFREAFDQVIAGELTMSSAGYPDMSYIIPELILVGQVYVVRDYAHLLSIINSDYGKMIEGKFNKLGVHTAGVWYAGRNQTTSNRPLNSIKDFKGLKLRVPQVEALLSFAEAVGSSASPVAFSELYLALQTGQVEAQQNSLSTIESQKIYEVQKFLAVTDHFLGSTAIFINNEEYNNFTEEQKKWFNEAIKYGGEVSKEMFEEEEKYLLEKFKNEYGVTVTYPDLMAFREAMKPHYDKLEKEYGKDSITELINIR